MVVRWSSWGMAIAILIGLVGSAGAGVCQSVKYPGLVLDERVVHNGEAFLDEVNRDYKVYQVTLNNSFRTYEEQERLYQQWFARGKRGNPVAKPGSSRHESGFAMDLNGLQELTFNQWNSLLNIGEKHGLRYILGDWEGQTKLDWPHFEANPESFGLTLEVAIRENRVRRETIPLCWQGELREAGAP